MSQHAEPGGSGRSRLSRQSEHRPEQSPGQSPGQSPEYQPGQSPGQSPEYQPGQSPGQSAEYQPEQSPGQSPEQSPERSERRPSPGSRPSTDESSSATVPPQRTGSYRSEQPERPPPAEPGASTEPGTPAGSDARAARNEPGRRRGGRAWLRIFLVGLVLWLATVVVTYVTRNTNLLPTVILLGSFLVPVSFVAWAFTREEGGIGLRTIAEAFLLGGVLGVLAASVLESYFLSPSPFTFVGVGLIEELAKGLALLFVARNVPYDHRSTRHGLILGATVGFGFAGFETAGYALNAMITVEGLDLRAVVETELLRSVLAPVGHGLWTAILGGLLFAAANRGRWRLTGGVLAGYLGVSLLHALWDSSRFVALVFTLLLTGIGQPPRSGYLNDPTPAQVHLFTGLTWLTMAVVAAVGLIWLWAAAGRRPREGAGRWPG